jgi:GMP synthase-like glutamine amidotransferase
MIKVYTVGSRGDARPFDPKVWDGVEIVQRIADSDIFVLPGGADISPDLYGHKKSFQTQAGYFGQIDHLHASAFQEAKRQGKFIFGICRGAQLSCALSGGKLIQHVTGHHATHDIYMTMFDGLPASRLSQDGTPLFAMSSCHHQMMWPWTADEFEILAWSAPERSSVYVWNGDNEIDPYSMVRDFVEPEIVWFPGSKALAIQGHPEWLQEGATLDAINAITFKYFHKQ